MTDNEIIKALEDSLKNFDGKAVDFMTISFALDIINRQKARIKSDAEYEKHILVENRKLKAVIEDLRHEIRNLECEKGQLEGTTEYLIGQAKTEGFKEFAERLKSFLSIDCRTLTEDNPNTGDIIFGYEIDDVDIFIDNLVEEMVGEE